MCLPPCCYLLILAIIFFHTPSHISANGCGFNDFLDVTDYIRKVAFDPEDPGRHSISFPIDYRSGMDTDLQCTWLIEPGYAWYAMQITITQLDLTGDNYLALLQVEGRREHLMEKLYGNTMHVNKRITTAPGNVLMLILQTSERGERDRFTIEFFRFQAAMWGGFGVLDRCYLAISERSGFYDSNTHTCFTLHGEPVRFNVQNITAKKFTEAFDSCGPTGHLAFIPDEQLFNELVLRRLVDRLFDREEMRHSGFFSWIGLKWFDASTFPCQSHHCYRWSLPNGQSWPISSRTPWWHSPNIMRWGPSMCGRLIIYPVDWSYHQYGVETFSCGDGERQPFLCQEERISACPRIQYNGTENGTISSPNWPSYYPSQIRCYYVIEQLGLAERNDEHKIQLTLDSVDFGDDTQVSVYEALPNSPYDDGSHYPVYTEVNLNNLAQQLALWDKDTTIPSTVVSTNDYITVVFESKSNDQKCMGFKASYSEVPIDKCEVKDVNVTLAENETWVYNKTHIEVFLNHTCTSRNWKTIFEAPDGLNIHCFFHHNMKIATVLYDPIFSQNPIFREDNGGRTIYYPEEELYLAEENVCTSSNKAVLEMKYYSRYGFLPGYHSTVNISCRAIRRPLNCSCPKERDVKNNIKRIYLYHNKDNCWIDCFFLINESSGHEISDWNLMVNYTMSGIDGNGRLETTTDLLVHHNNWVRLLSYDGQIMYNKYGGATRLLHYHNEPSQGFATFNITYQWVPGCHCRNITELIANNNEQMITSPNYPKEYCSGLHCTWVITSKENARITFKIEHLSLESERDFLIFIETSNTTVNNSRRFTGIKHHRVPAFEMVAPIVRFEVTGAYSSRYNGFQLFFTLGDQSSEANQYKPDSNCMSIPLLIFLNILFMLAIVLSFYLFRKHQCCSNPSNDRVGFGNVIEMQDRLLDSQFVE